MRAGPVLIGVLFGFIAFGLLKDGEGGAGLVCALISIGAFSAAKKEWKYKGSVDIYRKE